MDGTKMPINRVYCMSNVLPTQVTDLCLDLNPVRQKARSKLMTLDQFNLQDIIQKTVEKAESDAQEHGETIITTAGENCLFYANLMFSISRQLTIPTKSFVEVSFDCCILLMSVIVLETPLVLLSDRAILSKSRQSLIFYNYQVTYKCLIKLT